MLRLGCTLPRALPWALEEKGGWFSFTLLSVLFPAGPARLGAGAARPERINAFKRRQSEPLSVTLFGHSSSEKFGPSKPKPGSLLVCSCYQSANYSS